MGGDLNHGNEIEQEEKRVEDLLGQCYLTLSVKERTFLSFNFQFFMKNKLSENKILKSTRKMKTKKAHQTQAHALSILNRHKITFQKTELKQKIT